MVSGGTKRSCLSKLKAQSDAQTRGPSIQHYAYCRNRMILTVRRVWAEEPHHPGKKKRQKILPPTRRITLLNLYSQNPLSDAAPKGVDLPHSSPYGRSKNPIFFGADCLQLCWSRPPVALSRFGKKSTPKIDKSWYTVGAPHWCDTGTPLCLCGVPGYFGQHSLSRPRYREYSNIP